MILSSGCDVSSIKEKLKNKSNETKNYYLFFLDKTFPRCVCIFKNFKRSL